MGDVYIKLSADEKNALDALRKLQEAQKGNEDAARSHGRAWQSMGDQAKAAADAATGGMISAATQIGIVAVAVEKLKNLYSQWSAEIRASAEEFKKMTTELSSAVSSMGQMQNFGAISLQVANVAKNTGLDMSTATRLWQTSGGRMDVFQTAAAGKQMGMDSNQLTAYAGQILELSKASGGKTAVGDIADMLTVLRARHGITGEQALLPMQQLLATGMEGGLPEAAALLGQATAKGASPELLGRVADVVMHARTQGPAVQPTGLRPGAREEIVDLDRQIEAHRRAQVQFEEYRRTESGDKLSRMDAENRDASLRAQGEALRERKADLERQKVFTSEEVARNALLALPEGQQALAMLTQPQFAALLPRGASKIPALGITEASTAEFFAGAKGAAGRQAEAAMANPIFAGMFEAEKAVAGADIDYQHRNRMSALQLTIGRAALRQLVAEDNTKWKFEDMEPKLVAAAGMNVDLRDVSAGWGNQDRWHDAFAKMWAPVEKALTAGTNPDGSQNVKIIGSYMPRRLKPSRNAGALDATEENPGLLQTGF